jgi:uncharacterized protein DUF4157
MSQREFTPSARVKSSTVQSATEPQTTPIDPQRTVQADLWAKVTTATGAAGDPTIHAAMLHHMTGGRLSRGAPTLLQLQRLYGNRYVQRVVHLAQQTTGEAHVPLTHRPLIQTKLVVGPAGDAYEHEADRVAKQVASQINLSGSQIAQRQAVSEKDDEDEVMRKPLVQRPLDVGGTEVSSELEVSLQRARGGGQSLPEKLRVPVEQVFGADFSGVHVHTGTQAHELSRSLRARAFTTGQDIFFRHGEYNPASAAGRELLAHELTHVVQQDGGTHVRRVLQRAVGFEFEVGSWTLEKLGAPLSTAQEAGTAEIPNSSIDTGGLNKDVEVYHGDHFKLKPDEADDGSFHVEFVTDPPGFQETKEGKKQLKKSMKDLKNLCDKLLGMRSGAKLKRTGDIFPKILSDDIGATEREVLITLTPRIDAEPQVTGGIRLDQLADVMEKLSPGTLGSESPKQKAKRLTGRSLLSGKQFRDADLVGASPGHARAGYSTFYATLTARGVALPSATPSAEMVGLLALIRSYLIAGSQAMAFPKSVAALMARTDMGTIFDAVPDKAYWKHWPDGWATLALTVAGMSGTGAQPFFSGTSSYVPLPIWGRIQGALSRARWLKSITKGPNRDLLTVDNFPDTGVKGYMFGLGGLKQKMDVVGQKRLFGSSTRIPNAPIFEFRRMMSSIPHHAWPTLAEEIFDYLKEINDLRHPTFTAEKTFESMKEDS